MFGHVRFALPFCFSVFAVVGCDEGSSSHGIGTHSIETMSTADVVRHHDPEKVARGRQVYQERCAACHGDKAQGASSWRRRDADGFYPPPPLNGTGHAWHHSRTALQEMIRDGSPAGQGKMPAWNGKLSDQDVDAVIEWFQSLWPDPVYGEWFAMEQRSFGR